MSEPGFLRKSVCPLPCPPKKCLSPPPGSTSAALFTGERTWFRQRPCRCLPPAMFYSSGQERVLSRYPEIVGMKGAICQILIPSCIIAFTIGVDRAGVSSSSWRVKRRVVITRPFSKPVSHATRDIFFLVSLSQEESSINKSRSEKSREKSALPQTHRRQSPGNANQNPRVCRVSSL